MTAAHAAEAALFDLLVDRLTGAGLTAAATDVVLAAAEGDDELAAALDGAVGLRATARPRPQLLGDVPGVYVGSIIVEGFRGIGDRAALNLRPGPGLTLVTGRNGSGKSSFAEAAELVMTGSNYRWAERGAAWRAGWRNLHAGGRAAIEVALTVEGSSHPVTMRRAWAPDADLDAGSTVVDVAGQPPGAVDIRSWPAVLATYRPFLSYAELGGLLHGKPSDMYDSLHAILGLDLLTSAERRLGEVRRRLSDREKSTRQEQSWLLAALRASSDPRAVPLVAAMADGRRPDLDAVEALATGIHEPGEPGTAGALRAVATLTPPDEHIVLAASERLRAAATRAAGFTGTPAGDALRLAELLLQALEHHAAHGGGPCPVCGTGTLDDAWREATSVEASRLAELARTASDAQRELVQASAAARALLPQVPLILRTTASGAGSLAADLDLELVPVATAWRTFAALREVDDPIELAAGMAGAAAPLAAAVSTVVAAAKTRRDVLDAAWRPLATRVAAWVRDARETALRAPALAAATAGASWLKTATQQLRDERLRPYAEASGAIWAGLRQESNVDLGPIRLAGSSTRRRVSLDVTVDGVDCAALGVMSQGELHALGLALFLPRATAEDSPFRFVMIDDPVQAMDPAKVDGLARVLADVARTRQVVVFTHDDRLADAVRRLPGQSRILEVVRSERSAVEVRACLDPVARYLDDARALAATRDLPADIASTLVASCCRGAVEAACHEITRARRLAAGARHADVEDALTAARTTNQKAALALFDDPRRRSSEVMAKLNEYGRWAGTTFVAVKGGVHEPHRGDLRTLIRNTRDLVERMRAA